VKVLVLGGGGREHALAAALTRDPSVDEVHACPGNPGIAAVAERHAVDPLDTVGVLRLAEHLAADLVVIGPEAPLVAGVGDALRSAGIATFGPGRGAAAIEGSKAFAKQVMADAGVPTGSSAVCETPAEVASALARFGPPYVVKDDGLAAGKGVVVTADRESALAHAAACARVVVEEYLDGPEVSLFAVCDGRTALAMQPAQDFKRLRDGDVGPNTGGMGAYTPLPWTPPGLVDEVYDTVLQPTVAELARRGLPFVGLLYAGLALTSSGVRVIEFNARFGDPETQPLMQLFDSPLGQVLYAASIGRLDEVGPLRWRSGAAVSVVMAAAGYPGTPRTGDVISGVVDAEALPGVQVLHAGTARSPGPSAELVTNGGRVLAVTATADTLDDARARAYAGVARIDFAGAQFRTDIAARAAADAAATRPAGGLRDT
jgi:phosphoribosylamine---glycine ligase